jgi:hypothetical protein
VIGIKIYFCNSSKTTVLISNRANFWPEIQ